MLLGCSGVGIGDIQDNIQLFWLFLGCFYVYTVTWYLGVLGGFQGVAMQLLGCNKLGLQCFCVLDSCYEVVL